MSLDDTSTELVLPTFEVLARFLEPAGSGEEAVHQVEERLRAQQEPFQEVTVERDEGSDRWMVVARFVLVSVDSGTAVGGLHDTLVSAGLTPDEVWAVPQVF